MSRHTIGTTYPTEGYVIIRCGDTELQVQASLFHHVRIVIDGASPEFVQLCSLSRHLDLLYARVMRGETGDTMADLSEPPDHCGICVDLPPPPPLRCDPGEALA